MVVAKVATLFSGIGKSLAVLGKLHWSRVAEEQIMVNTILLGLLHKVLLT